MKIVGLRRIGIEKLVILARSQIWWCDGCGQAFVWSQQSEMYGSHRNIEDRDFHRVWIACCQDCKSVMPEDFPKGVKRPDGQLVVIG
jgi:hypothetical protein